MPDFDLQRLSLLPAPAFLALVVGFAVFAGLFAVEPGFEEGGGFEVGLAVADDLGGGYGGGFVDCYGRVEGVSWLGR